MTTKTKIIKINRKVLNHHIKHNTDKCRICRHKFKINEWAVSKYVSGIATFKKEYQKGFLKNRFAEVNEKASRRVLYCIKCAKEKNLITEKGVI